MKKILMGDFIEVPFSGKTIWMLVIDVITPIPNEFINDDDKSKYKNADYQVKYWKDNYDITIEKPEYIILAVHFGNDGMYWCYPDNIIKDIKSSTINEKLYYDFMNEITAPASRELRFKYLNRIKQNFKRRNKRNAKM
jgi:hypothetical protein